MIEIKEKKDCCGCHACASVCPRSCIAMLPDEEGFLYPKVDRERCIDCNRCVQVCPVLHPAVPRRPLQVWAAKNPNEEVRMKSSSGGVFTLLAEWIIGQGGVVFGARYDADWNVVHDWTDTLDGLAAFRGAKYMQSRMGNCFKEVRHFLNQGRPVLFSGTPCQVAGLKRFIRKENPLLWTVEIVCHGVPSPKVWQVYLTHLNRKKEPLTLVDMRDKSIGWHQYGMKIASASHHLYVGKAVKNTYSKGFLADLYLRPSCHHCPARSGRSLSDFTLGDFWGIRRFYPAFDDNRGVGLVFVYSEQAMNLYKALDVLQIEATYGQAILDNPCIEHNTLQTSFREEFWKRFPKEGIPVIDKLCRKKKKPIGYRIINRLYKWIRT